MDETSDNQLVESFIDGDKASYDEIIQRYHKNVYRLAYKYTSNRSDAEDIAQNTFLRAYENLLKYPKEVNLKPWLLTICTNLCRNKAKKKKSFNFSALESTEDDRRYEERLVGKTKDPAEIARQDESVNSVQDAIDQLPEKYQLVIQLRFLEDLSYKEIAEALSLPLNTVKVHINRAKKHLEQYLAYEAT
jgi:RNA polymerase sigma-70 factor, ECF subfamily